VSGTRERRDRHVQQELAALHDLGDEHVDLLG
jgi:hypothetical protein